MNFRKKKFHLTIHALESNLIKLENRSEKIKIITIQM